MFCNNIYQEINSIGSRKFENDKLYIELNHNANFFLMELDSFANSLIPGNLFDHIYIEKRAIILGPHRGLSDLRVKGLRLKKTEFNSIGNEVKPEFLLALKKSTRAYLTALASNWEVCTDTDQLDDACFVIVENKFEGMGAPHCILEKIAENRGFENKIKVLGDTPDTFISGRWGDLKHFSHILKEEAMGEKEPPSLTQIVCRHICHDLITHQSDKKYKLLPIELLEKINEEAIFCLNTDARKI